MVHRVNFKGFIFDIDGSLCRGSRAIIGAAETLVALRKAGKKILLLTNNSTGTSAGYAQKLSEMDLVVSEEEVLTSAMATATYMKDFDRKGVLVVGEEALVSALRGEGFPIMEESAAEGAGYVVCGLDRRVTYAKLAAACVAVQHGAQLIAANADRNLPVDEGVLPGAGALLCVITETTRAKPVIVGKPSRLIMGIALRRLGLAREEVAIIGDSIETDVMAGRNSGIFSILVLTGVTSRQMLEKSKIKPDIVLDSISDLPALLD